MFHVEMVGVVSHQERKHYFVYLSFKNGDGGGSCVQCQLDTGATCNVMSFDTFCDIKQNGNPVIQTTSTKLQLYDGSVVPMAGEDNLNRNYNGVNHKLNFKIVEGFQKPLLSGETCTSMGLITVHVINCICTSKKTDVKNIFVKHRDVFEGLGCLPGEYHLEINPDVEPVKHTPRKITIPLKAELKAHIEGLEKMGVLKKVTEPTKWISSQVAVRKKSKLRLCIDPKDLIKHRNTPITPCQQLKKSFRNLPRPKFLV